VTAGSVRRAQRGGYQAHLPIGRSSTGSRNSRISAASATVRELQEALGASQQNVSKHLGILHAAGMVRPTKQGTHTRYAISDPSVLELCDLVCGGIRRQAQQLDTILQPA
jgi:DNA-binding transcriptional ArsR family regulator